MAFGRISCRWLTSRVIRATLLRSQSRRAHLISEPCVWRGHCRYLNGEREDDQLPRHLCRHSSCPDHARRIDDGGCSQVYHKDGVRSWRGFRKRNPAPFGWLAIGLVPSAVPTPSTAFNVEGLPVWSAAVRAQRAGSRNARILCLGDSTTAGSGALGVQMADNDKSMSYPSQLCTLMNARGSFSSWSSVVSNNNANNFLQYDYRFLSASGWGVSSGTYGTTLGGFLLKNSSTAKLNWRPLNSSTRSSSTGCSAVVAPLRPSFLALTTSTRRPCPRTGGPTIRATSGRRLSMQTPLARVH